MQKFNLYLTRQYELNQVTMLKALNNTYFITVNMLQKTLISLMLYALSILCNVNSLD